MSDASDDNDRLKAGTLPEDPASDCEPLVQAAPLDAPRLDSFLDDALGRMLQRARGEEQPLPVPWPSVAKALGGGLWPGLHLLVGNTKCGKSQWALQLALHAAQQANTPVLYVGLELGELDLCARLLGMLSGERWSEFFLGKLSPETVIERSSKHLETLRALPFHMDIASPYGWPYTRLTELGKSMQAHYQRPFLIVLDFLQLVESPLGAREDMRERIGRAAYTARAVARDCNAAVLVVSSTARENYALLEGRDPKGKKNGLRLGEGNPSGLIGLGKESGEVEFGADSVLVLSREPIDTNLQALTQAPTPMWLALAGGRAVTPCWIPMAFNGGHFWEPTLPQPAALTV